MRNDCIGVQTGFTTASHNQIVRSGHDRDFGVFDRHHRFLEALDRHGNLFKRTFGDRHNQQHQIGSG